MTAYFNPMQNSQITSNGDTLQTEGNGKANHSTTNPYTVPEGAQYVSVWSDALFTVKASPLPEGITENVTSVYPAGRVVQIPNVIGGKTVITVAEI